MRKAYGGVGGPLEGLQTENELTSHLTGHSVQCGVDQTTNPTGPWIVLIWPTLHNDGSFGGLSSTQRVLLLSVFPSRSLPDRPSSSKDCKDRGFPSKPLLHGIRMPVDAHRPFTVTWEGVIVKKMLFEDCPVRHDPLSARISSSRESPPPPWWSRQACARWERAFAGSKFETMASRSNHAMTPCAIRGKKTTSMALFQFGCQRPVYFLCHFLSVSLKACATSSYTSDKEPRCFFYYYYMWTREPAPVRGGRRALLLTCKPSFLPVLQGRFLSLVLQV